MRTLRPKPIASQLMVPGRDAGFDRPCGGGDGGAVAAARRERGRRGAGLGLRREELEHLEARQVALKSWCPGSSMKVDEAGALAPLVWARPDGWWPSGRTGAALAVSRNAAGTAPLVLVRNKTAYVRSEQDILAVDAEAGTELWRWRPAEGRVLTG